MRCMCQEHHPGLELSPPRLLVSPRRPPPLPVTPDTPYITRECGQVPSDHQLMLVTTPLCIYLCISLFILHMYAITYPNEVIPHASWESSITNVKRTLKKNSWNGSMPRWCTASTNIAAFILSALKTRFTPPCAQI